MLTITKEFHFSASHVLEGLPSWHPCARMHGHNYVVVLELRASRDRLTPSGFVRDYRDLDEFKQWVDKTLDHRHLNESMEWNPTSENLAIWIYERWIEDFPELTAVRVCETAKTTAEYRPGALSELTAGALNTRRVTTAPSFPGTRVARTGVLIGDGPERIGRQASGT
nr:6-carboxytetrahydropterin synthase [Glycomyces xiaoerkulensis]